MFVVMELGEMNCKILLNSVPSTILEEEDIITILYNQLCALNFVHQCGIVHRNIQPSNYLVDSQCTVKLCDFGSARTLPCFQEIVPSSLLSIKKKMKIDTDREFSFRDVQVASNRKMLKDGQKQRAMSPHVQSRWYRAPEIILVDQNYNQAIDIWGLGCILGEMIHCST
jgi:mitogen-activated protein kinase 1/3